VSAAELRESTPKFFGTMAYPYMNGTLHAGHGFSVSKVEFAAGVARMQGKRALFPMGFHCTGMPIKACADKLAYEISMFGHNFEKYQPEDGVVEEKKPEEKQFKEDVTKFTSKKSKTAQKSAGLKYQFQIIKSIGVPVEEIHRFADAQYWLDYFPPIAITDLTNFGARIDWRRTFVTTDANPYYDTFVRWQMNRLKEQGKVRFGERLSIYSIKDGQACMDHDRSEGEAVKPQEYTALKLKVLEWAPKAEETIKAKVPADASVFLVPATLRPETMYGQTCCFVGPKITYGIFRASANEYYIVTDRAARNMAYQKVFEKQGVIEKVGEIGGTDLVGSLVYAPLSVYKEGVRVLPMESVLPTKGTGVVTCVASDSPDDYVTVRELAKKPEFYGIQKEWAELEIVPIVETPSYGDLCAKTLVEKLKINSPKDTKQLAEAKELAYKEGFFQGIMKIGDFKGERVENAKPKIKQQLIAAGEAFAYAEPERKVVSRSGDDCIVSLLNQWYLDYGSKEWLDTALEWVDTELETWGEETKRAYRSALLWLDQWPCARTYGLGSKLPWDHNFLVESLSDSTIYMAYYTVARFLHTDLTGSKRGVGNIGAEQMTDDVWDYIFCHRELDDTVLKSGIAKTTLESMRREFQYFYPLDLRSSAKDLIPNHLLFFLYCHVALFPREYWPRGIRSNGHLMMNSEKMSKSTGNFLTLRDMVAKYGADASRIALADSGDSMADGNLEEDVADGAILRLFNLREWCEQAVKDIDQLRSGELNTFQDALFNNDLNCLAREAISLYESTDYKLALRASFYDFTSARDFYREACSAAEIPMHRDVVLRYIELQALLIAVIAPHWAEHIWREVLKRDTSIQNERFPVVPEPDAALTAEREYVRATASNINSAEGLQMKKKAKGKDVAFDPRKPKRLTIYTTGRFPAWQENAMQVLQEEWDADAKAVRDEKAMLAKVGQGGNPKKAMPFLQALKKRLISGESTDKVLNRSLGFDERETLKRMMPSLVKSAGLNDLKVLAMEDGGKRGTDLVTGETVEVTAPTAEAAVPGAPTFYFENV
jgi:leucyl-tRNA synthetase